MKIKHLIVAAALSAAVSSPHARCIANDSWRGADKSKHAAVGAAVGWIVTLQTGKVADGVLWSAVAGVGKELLDSDGSGTCSLQDAAVTVLGGVIGAYTGGLVVTHTRGRTVVSYSTTF